MAKKHLIDTGRWTYPKFRALKLQEKIIFEYLLSNKHCSKTGIYRVYSGGIHDELGDHIFSTEEIKKIILELENSELVKYDQVNHIIYIKNFHRFVPFGSMAAHIIAAELINSMKEYEHENFWKEYFWENYSDMEEYFLQAEKNAKEKDKKVKGAYENFLQNPSINKVKEWIKTFKEMKENEKK